MKKKILLNAIIITLLIISVVSIIIAAFMTGKIIGLLATGLMSYAYVIILSVYKND